jgi:hypothetical protein
MLIEFRITDAAKRVLQANRAPEKVASVSFSWGVDPSVGKALTEGSLSSEELKRDLRSPEGANLLRNGAWTVGHYLRTDVPPSDLFKVDGVELYVDARWQDQLSGKTLDFRDGYFEVIDR